ncbi:MAG: Flp pilus assembly protein CpaB [Anaerolineae bacterium]|nr:Flp pilus assembly protein CpaB [Anaerolineae bacterium]
MASRRRGWVWLLVGLVFALLAAFVAMAVVELRVQQSTTAAAPSEQRQATQAEAVAPVVVALAHITTTRAIEEAQVSLQEWPADIIPEGAATSIDDVVGKIAMGDIYPGEVVMSMRLADPDVTTANVAFTMARDKVIFALPPDDLMSNINLLQPGDLVDILFTLKPEQEVKATPGAPTEEGRPEALGDPMFTTDVIQGQKITAIVVRMPETTAQRTAEGAAVQPTAVPQPRAILLAMAPQDALILKYFRDAGGVMDIVLRHRTNEELIEVEPVNYDYVKDKYGLPVQELLPVR